MDKFLTVLEMNGHGFFIWSAYGVWFVLIVLLIIKVFLRKREIERKLEHLNKEK